ncbi:MAG: hypothetical protein WAV11_02555 [Minisyncoccia bacterium]
MNSIKFDAKFFLGWWKLLFLTAGEKIEEFLDWLFMLSFLIFGLFIDFFTFGPKKPEPEEIRNVPLYTTKVVLVLFLLWLIVILGSGIIWMVWYILEKT